MCLYTVEVSWSLILKGDNSSFVEATAISNLVIKNLRVKHIKIISRYKSLWNENLLTGDEGVDSILFINYTCIDVNNSPLLLTIEYASAAPQFNDS